MQWRLKCRLFGCEESEYCVCERCGAYEHEPDFIWGGVFGWFRSIRWKLTWWWEKTNVHCWQCGKNLVLRKKYEERFCSEKCWNKWIPF